jgi:hypothetical protein
VERCTSNSWIEWPDKATYEATAAKMETDEWWKARFLADFRAPLIVRLRRHAVDRRSE